MDSVKGRRLAALEERNRGITKASTWVAANQAQFRGRVYGPVMIEVEVANPLHASMLEQHVPSEWPPFHVEHVCVIEAEFPLHASMLQPHLEHSCSSAVPRVCSS